MHIAVLLMMALLMTSRLCLAAVSAPAAGVGFSALGRQILLLYTPFSTLYIDMAQAWPKYALQVDLWTWKVCVHPSGI